MLIVDGWTKFSVQDDWKKGWIGEGSLSSGSDTFTANSPEELVLKLKQFTYHFDCIELNACEEDGRIDIHGMETEEGIFASRNEIAEWKQGNLVLYAVTYTFYVFEAVPYNLIGE